MAEPVGIYISVPFCKAKCSFCNFASDAFAADRMQPYLDCLCKEIEAARAKVHEFGAFLPAQADTVYFGGGTPSLLAAGQFLQIFERLRSEFEIPPDAEITLECAPGQLAGDTLDELQRLGMNRISFGVQSFVDKECAAVGRLHTHDQCLDEIRRVRLAGVRSIGIDMIAGMPYQTEASWQFSVQQAIASDAEHVSVYMLEVDEKSRLGHEVMRQGTRYHAAAVPSDDQTTEWYQLACEEFDRAGLQQYEISNFAKSGHRSRHNLKYWLRQPYIGFGLDAHSMLFTEKGGVRFSNTNNLDAYMGRPFAPRITSKPEWIGAQQAFEESLFLGLRLNEGVRLERLRREFGNAIVESLMLPLAELTDAGLIEVKGDDVLLTDRGRMISNEVFNRLLIEAAV